MGAGVNDVDHRFRTVVATVHRRLLDLPDASANIDANPVRIESCVRDVAPLCTDREVESIVRAVLRQLDGFGPLEPLLADPTITEVMVNGSGTVWIERRGRIESSGVVLDADAVRLVVDRIVTPLGLRLDRVVPSVDARLPDGSRVHIAIPPMAIDGPHVTIRRFSATVFPLDAFGPPPVVGVLERAVHDRLNVVVIGATGAGKTSLLNALAAHIMPNERVITIEDAAELRLPAGHVVRMEARPPNAEGVGEITLRALVRNALRMRPDRLVVGEVRGAEALEMIQALNTGHAGSLSTCHANGPHDALDRLVAMAMMSEAQLPADLVRAQLHSALDLVVHLGRGSDGRRTVADIARLDGGGLHPVVESGRLVPGHDHG